MHRFRRLRDTIRYMRRIIVKEGPLVLIRNVLVMEFLAATFIYFAKFAENYETLYDSWPIHAYITFHVFLVLFFSLFQLVYVLLLFLEWYFSHYEIHDKEIIRKSGLFFRRRKSVSLADVTSVELYQSPLSRMIYHATIILEHADGRTTKIKNVGNFEEYLHIIKQSVHGASGRLITHDAKALIEQGEGLFVEFKETLRYDTRKGEVSREMERMVLKTIVGFLNADGGTLLIGVGDNGTIAGLEKDYNALPKKNRDGFENHLSMLLKTAIGLPFAKYVSTGFESIDGKDVCVVNVRESHKPAYLQGADKKEEFFVRVGNSTQPFSMSEAQEYINTHWK
jgi:membrane protein YdbS with pleckstrin-like domain